MVCLLPGAIGIGVEIVTRLHREIARGDVHAPAGGGGRGGRRGCAITGAESVNKATEARSLKLWGKSVLQLERR
jgi:hypothetical protein